MKYLRIGTEYYKVVQKPNLNGTTSTEIIRWSRSTIFDDFGKEYLKEIPKYEGFTVLPSHTNYKREVKGFYNKYMPLDHKRVKNVTLEDIPNTLKFLEHIFAEQLEIGLDYLTLLWQRPLQILPIFCLVSEERNTGKTTFLNWLKKVFQDNMTINKNEDFRSRFNADWSEKLIVAIDEALLDKREDSERIKNLSTSVSYKTESKGKDKLETNFFGKFILCSNLEQSFILIDENEIRYWVRKIPVISQLNPDFNTLLLNEIPQFISLLDKRVIASPKRTRMWFTKEQINTDALNKLIRGTKFYFEKELILILEEMFEDYEIDTISLSYNDIIEIFKQSNQRVSRREISDVIIGKWKLTHKNSSYFEYYKCIDPITNQWFVSSKNKKGRHFVIEKKFIEMMLNC